MKRKFITTILMVGLLSLGVQADITNTISSAKMSIGYMNVFNLPSDGGAFQFDSSWGVGDLTATFNGEGDVVTMIPNSIGDPNEYWYQEAPGGDPEDPNNGGPGAPGNKIMEANLYAQFDGDLAGETLVFAGEVTSMTLSNSHTVTAFIRDFSPDYSTFEEDTLELTTNGTFYISLDLINDTARHVQYGIQMKGVNVWVTDLAPFGSIEVTAIEDTAAPTPDPMAFFVPPFPTGDSSISMTASNAIDNFYDVMYYFTCVTGPGNDSGWQSSPTYEDTGLTPDTYYEYTVKARDTSANSNINVTAESPEAFAITPFTDGDAPTPNPMVFTELPMAISPISISMTASNAVDLSGVEYYFTCTSGNGPDSEWQSSPTYVATGLNPKTEYSYTVTARDLSANMNTTTSSVPASATTPVLLKWMSNSLTNYTGDSTQVATTTALGLDSLEVTVTTSTNKAMSFDSSGATFGLNATDDAGRNILRTIASDYSASSFEAFVTVEMSDASQNAFMGFGQGLDGAFGVPDLSLEGVSSVFTEFTPTLTKIWSQYQGNAGDENLINVETSLGTHRMKLAYDADAQEATVTVDLDYVGGSFSNELTFGTVTTTNLSLGAPVRVFIGGDDGMVFKDLVIKPTSLLIDSFTTEVAGGGTEIFWQSEVGAIYDIEYTTNLVSDSWTTDPGGSDIFASGGMISATSTVDSANVFYRLFKE